MEEMVMRFWTNLLTMAEHGENAECALVKIP